jgi:hypothetical protein
VQKTKQFFSEGNSETKKLSVATSILAQGNARALPASSPELKDEKYALACFSA